MFAPWIIVIVVSIQFLNGSTRDIRIESVRKYVVYEQCTQRMQSEGELTVAKLNVIKDSLFKDSTGITMKNVGCEKKDLRYREARK